MTALKDILTGGGTEVEQRSTSTFAGINYVRRDRRTARPVTTVRATSEFRRIKALPRRILDLTEVTDVTDIFHRPEGTESLFPIQSIALIESAMMNGGFCPMPVGSGKTLVTLLLPTALESKKAVLLMPTQLKQKTLAEIDSFYNRHFVVPLEVLTIVAYEELSLAKNFDLLYRLAPDLVIADEAHKLRHRSSARTKRFRAYITDNPGCRFVPMSGTMTSRSVTDYWFIEFALRKASPVPRGYVEIQEWAGAIDVKPQYVSSPGALLQLCEPGEDVRSGFRRRLVESQGVIAAEPEAIGTALIIVRCTLKVPLEVQSLLTEVEQFWSLDGDEFDDIFKYTRVLRQLACGFYYRWNWPDGLIDYEWVEARSNWNKAVREKLKQSRMEMDSPLLLSNAAERSLKARNGKDPGNGPRWDAGAELWEEWKLVKHRPDPPIETKWVSDFLLLDTIRRAKEVDAPCIIWYEHQAVGRRLGELTGWTVYGEGADATNSREAVIIASINTQREGKNLQHHFSRNIYTSLPANCDVFEQSIGRTHRRFQMADEVIAWWYAHTPECAASMTSVIEQANYKKGSPDGVPKVLFADHVNDNDNE